MKQRPVKAASIQRKAIAAAVAATLAAPTVFLSYQQDWAGDPAQVKVWEKSRRIGASWCDAADSVLEAASDDGQDALYIGYSEDMAREYMDDCAMWAKAFNKAAGEIGETMFEDAGPNGEKNLIKAFRIDFPSGHKVLALSSRPRSIRGKQGKVTIDEAAFHDDLPGLLKAALAMLIWGGRVAILSSHNGEDNPFNLLVKDIRDGKVPYSLHTTTFDDALAAGLYQRVKLVSESHGKALGYPDRKGNFVPIETQAQWRQWIVEKYGEAANEELFCVPRAGSGVYIPRSVVMRAQRDGIPVIRYAKPPEWVLNDNRLEEAQVWIAEVLKPILDGLDTTRRHALGQDFGRDGDLSIPVVLEEVGPGHWRTVLHLELRRIPFDVQQLIVFFLLDNLPHFHHAKFDARGNGQAHAEAALQRYGPTRIECVMATPTWYAANFANYKAALEEQSIELPMGEDIPTDHRRVILKNGYPTMDPGRDKGTDGQYRHGDSAISYLLAWAATLNEGEPAAGETVDPPVSRFEPDAARGRRRVSIFRRAA